MPLKFQPKCKPCQKCKAEPGFLKRLYASKHFVVGGESLLKIARENNMVYQPLHYHVKNHMHLTEDKMVAKELDRLTKASQQIALKKAVKTVDARGEFIARGMEKLLAGDFEEGMTVSSWLTALRDSDTREAKVQDQGLDFIKTMAVMRSGELAPHTVAAKQARELIEAEWVDFDPWEEVAPEPTDTSEPSDG